MKRAWIFFFLIFSTSPLWSRAAERPCPKSAKVHREKDLKKLRTSVERAALIGDESAMKSLVACDFMLGKPESDTGGFRRGANIVLQVGKILKGLKFKAKGDDYGTQVNVASEAPAAGFELVFRKDDATGWYWAGLNIVDSEILDKLLKGSYSIGSGDED